MPKLGLGIGLGGLIGRHSIGIDADALAYIQRVESADGATLESGVRLAIDNFVRGCKTDGIWDAIKASVILAGARTLSGALQPLVGAAPTNFNFVSDDYNRKTGLKGNAATKYLNSNRSTLSDPQNDFHIAVNINTAHASAGTGFYLGHGTLAGANGDSNFGRSGASPANLFFRNRNITASSSSGNGAITGFIGQSRSTSSQFVSRDGGVDVSRFVTSQTPTTQNINAFRSNSVSAYADARINFYSIGESLDLALLDARVTNLINAYAAAIP